MRLLFHQKFAHNIRKFLFWKHTYAVSDRRTNLENECGGQLVPRSACALHAAEEIPLSSG